MYRTLLRSIHIIKWHDCSTLSIQEILISHVGVSVVCIINENCSTECSTIIPDTISGAICFNYRTAVKIVIWKHFVCASGRIWLMQFATLTCNYMHNYVVRYTLFHNQFRKVNLNKYTQFVDLQVMIEKWLFEYRINEAVYQCFINDCQIICVTSGQKIINWKFQQFFLWLSLKMRRWTNNFKIWKFFECG